MWAKWVEYGLKCWRLRENGQHKNRRVIRLTCYGLEISFVLVMILKGSKFVTDVQIDSFIQHISSEHNFVSDTVLVTWATSRQRCLILWSYIFVFSCLRHFKFYWFLCLLTLHLLLWTPAMQSHLQILKTKKRSSVQTSHFAHTLPSTVMICSTLLTLTQPSGLSQLKCHFLLKLLLTSTTGLGVSSVFP